ncbi:hypothetical protein [Escherichia phage UPEC06]|nr:hypothetical protein [Escherichia phage UPEC06]
MKFEIGKYMVTVREGKSRNKIEVSFNHHPGLTRVYVDAPEDLIHPVFRKLFELKVKGIIDEVQKRLSYASVSNYIPTRHRSVKWSVREFKNEFTNLHGDIDEAKDNWDYNKAPAGSAFIETKFGDLKAFLEMRKGDKLNLTGE